MSDNWVLRRNQRIINIKPNTTQGRDDARIVMDSLIATDLTNYTNEYANDLDVSIQQKNTGLDCKAVELTRTRNYVSNGINMTSTKQALLVCYLVEEFTNET